MPCYKLIHVHLVMKHMPRLRNRAQTIPHQAASPLLHPAALVFSLNIVGVNNFTCSKPGFRVLQGKEGFAR